MRRCRSIVTIAYSRAFSMISRSRPSLASSASRAATASPTSSMNATTELTAVLSVTQCRHRGVHPDLAAVACAAADLHLEWGAAADEPVEHLVLAAPVLRVHHVLQSGVPMQLLVAKAGELAEAAIGQRDAAVQVHVDDAGRRLADHRPELLLGLAQRIFGVLARRDVEEREDHAADAVLGRAVRQRSGRGTSGHRRALRARPARGCSSRRGVASSSICG